MQKVSCYQLYKCKKHFPIKQNIGWQIEYCNVRGVAVRLVYAFFLPKQYQSETQGIVLPERWKINVDNVSPYPGFLKSSLNLILTYPSLAREPCLGMMILGRKKG